MTRIRTFGAAGLAGAVALAAAMLGAAAPARACDDGMPQVGYLGITDLSCNCTTDFSLASRDGKRILLRRWVFRSEPVVRELAADGPGAGKLREGDAITAVDGALITTRDGGDRFSHLTPGQNIRLTVRRDGRELAVPITVGSICPEELGGGFSLQVLTPPRAEETPMPPMPPVPPTPGMPPTPGVAPQAPETPRGWWMRQRRAPMPRVLAFPDAGPEALPRGWLGIGLTCQECGGDMPDGGTAPVWTFGTLPTVSYVDPEGPAARAGMRRGDQLTHIDGVSLLSEEGGRRFGAVRPGQPVKWTLVRDGSTRSLAMTAVQRPGERGLALDGLRDQLRAMRESRGEQDMSRQIQSLEQQIQSLDVQRQTARRVSQQSRRLRYAGSVAGSEVEVRGLGNVVVDDSGDEIVITTPDATIRIRPSARPEVTPAQRNKK